MREVGILEAKTHLSALVDEVGRGGEDIVITRHGKPLARLIAASILADLGGPSSGKELVERFRRLREQISRESPDTDNLTWEELKAMARE